MRRHRNKFPTILIGSQSFSFIYNEAVGKYSLESDNWLTTSEVEKFADKIRKGFELADEDEQIRDHIIYWEKE